MQVSDIKNSSERNKLILAGSLGIVAILFLWWTFFGFGSAGTSKVATPPKPQPTTANPRSTINNTSPQIVDDQEKDPENLRPIPASYPPSSAPEPGRNIFAYYEPTPTPTPAISIPTPTPTPTPPILLANVSPAMVYARTADFTLELSGDKFTPQLRVVIDNNIELATRYINAQQLSAIVPAAMISSPGSRQVMLRSADAKVYSNILSINVGAPPTPNYSYIGIIGTPKYIDTAILQDKSSKETLNVQRGDLLGGRFRVTSISEKELVVIDSNLKIKHTLAMTSQGDKGNPLQRPTPRVESEDDEP